METPSETPFTATCFRDLRLLCHSAGMALLMSSIQFRFFRAHGLLLAILCSFIAVPAQANERDTLALHKNDRNWPITTVSINGQPAQALLDTGATIALINDEHFAIDPMLSPSLRETRVLGIGGQRRFPVKELQSLSAGARSWQNLLVAVNTEDRFPVEQNILPVSVFGRSVVDFDFRNSRVELYDGSPQFVSGARRSVVGYTEIDGLIFIPIRINGVKGKALIDTGADVSFVNYAYADQAGGVAYFDDEKELSGSDLVRNKVRFYTFRNLTFAGNNIPKFQIPVLDTDLFRDLGFEEGPMMVIGMDVLKSFRLQVDLDEKRLTFLY